VLEDLDSHTDITRLTDRLLKEADTYGQFPTPVSRIVAAANLTEAPQSLLSDLSIAHAPVHLRAALRRAKGNGTRVAGPSRARVHINPETDHAAQKAFKRLHETSHELFPLAAHRGGSDRVRR
jgi:hypothetical protein